MHQVRDDGFVVVQTDLCPGMSSAAAWVRCMSSHLHLKLPVCPGEDFERSHVGHEALTACALFPILLVSANAT